MGKQNRQKGEKREKLQFVCWSHEVAAKGPVRFKQKEVWWDWSDHNKAVHQGFPSLGVTGEWVHEDSEGQFVGGQEILLL